MSTPQDPSPFAGAAPFYDKFRAPYPPAALAHIATAYALDAGSRVLDLGCGPGTLAIPLTALAGEVVAVDPDAGMLAQARELAAAKGRDNIVWLQARAEDLPPTLAPFRAVTLGQSFHWMDRDAVLASLATLIAPGGGLAILNPGKRRPQESWEPVATEVVTRFLGSRARHPRANPNEPQHEPALRRSAHFSDFTSVEFPSAITRDVASILGYLYSASSSTPAQFGEARPRFEAELRAALLAFNPSGVFNERLETEVILAQRGDRNRTGDLL